MRRRSNLGRRVLALAAPALLAFAGCVSVGDVDVESAGFETEVTQVQMISALVGGKNVFIPSTVVVTAGSGRSLSVFNTVDQPHGFAIPALGIEVVLQPGQEYVVELPTLEGGKVHAINCHLHPPHRSATLVVLQAR
ncbi:MAG: cupredoxin domain-containing protein [Myxococcota bacterium]